MYTPQTVLLVKNMAQAALFDMEVSGQISDGKWENVRPYDHWRWVCKIKYVFGDKLGYYGVSHRKYAISNLYKEFMKMAKEDGYLWPKRMLYYAQYAMLLPEKYAADFGTMDSFIEELGDNTNINTLEELKSSFKDYHKRYWKDEYDEVFSTENIQKFRNSNYTEADLNNDLKDLHNAVNNQLGWGYHEVA